MKVRCDNALELQDVEVYTMFQVKGRDRSVALYQGTLRMLSLWSGDVRTCFATVGGLKSAFSSVHHV